jgi:hypothetical protein
MTPTKEQTFTCPKGHVITFDRLKSVVDLHIEDIEKATRFTCEFGKAHEFSLKTAIRAKMFTKEQIVAIRKQADEHRRKFGYIIDTITNDQDLSKPGLHLMPAKPGTCPECAVDHVPSYPHNKDSLYYQYHFYAEHNRWPTWEDAMAHCTEDMKKLWRDELTKQGVKV